MKIILDTNFLLTTAKQKIDFNSLANQITDQPIKWLIPKPVIKELEQLSKRKGEKINDKISAQLSIQIIKTIPHQKIPLPLKNVDEGIIRYAKQNQAVIATLDKKMKQKFKGKILTIKGRKRLGII